MLEFFKQTKRKIENINNIFTATSDKLSNPEFMTTALYDSVDQILKDQSNVISLEELEAISSESYNYEHCVMLADILMYKVNRYKVEKFKVRKLFKTLIIIDYLLLNGVSAFIDLFKEQIEVFEFIETNNIYDDEELSSKEIDCAEFAKRKAIHIKEILRNKEKRLLQREFLLNAKLKLLENSKQNLFNKDENKKVYKPIAIFTKLKEIENFVSDKFDDFTETLIGIIDEDALETMNNERNRQMMLRGESFIDQIQKDNIERDIIVESMLKKIPKITKNQEAVNEIKIIAEQKINSPPTSVQYHPPQAQIIINKPLDPPLTNSNLLDL